MNISRKYVIIYIARYIKFRVKKEKREKKK